MSGQPHAQNVCAPRSGGWLGLIEPLDLFLLAMVVQVTSLGLFRLCFRSDLNLPAICFVRH